MDNAQPHSHQPSGVARAAARFRVVPADLLDVLPAEPEAEQPLEQDDAWNAVGRRIARVDAEPELATVYLTFEDGSYLTYAARIDEEGVILLDRFCEPAPSYAGYWVFDELEGESGPPPPGEAPPEGTPFHPGAWQAAAGRTVADLGWFEEGMQAFVHFEGGGYLTFAARSGGGAAYLLGYCSDSDPDDGEYFLFDPPANDE